MFYVALAIVFLLAFVTYRRVHRRTLARLEAENLLKTQAWIARRKAAMQPVTAPEDAGEDDFLNVLDGTGPYGVDDPAYVGTLSDEEAFSVFGSFASAYGFRRPGALSTLRD